MAEIGKKIGEAVQGNIPIPARKPFTPDYKEDNPKAKSFQFHYGISPHELGNRIRQQILERQGTGEDFDLAKRPLANYGAHGASTRIMEYPKSDMTFNFEGRPTRIGGIQLPSTKEAPELYEIIKALGEIPRLEEDVVFVAKDAKPGILRHELTHRAMDKLREQGKFSWGNIGLDEEDVVRLLDYVSGDDPELTEWWFSKSNNWKETPTHPEELLKKKSVLNLIMKLQKIAAEELEKEGIKTPIHFPKDLE